MVAPITVGSIHYLTQPFLSKIRAELKSTFASGRTKSVAWRQQQLLQLARLVQYNADALAEAIHKDLGKPRFEVFLTEINIIAQRSITCAKEVGEWEKDEDNSSSNQDWQVGWAQKIRKEPKGVALIIAHVLSLLITNTVLTNSTPKKTVELSTHSVPSTIVWRHRCWVLCRNQTVRSRNLFLQHPC